MYQKNAMPITLSEILDENALGENQINFGNASRGFRIINPQKDKVSCNYVNIPYIDTKNGIRRISCREYARLKGFPDTFSIDTKNSLRFYRLILQSPNVAVAQEIARKIFNALNSNMNDMGTTCILEEDNVQVERKKNLTNSIIDRQNILNNELALNEIRKTSNIQGIIFEEKVYFTKMMVASFF